MFDSLVAKTYLILAIQLAITLFAATGVIGYFRRLHQAGHPGVTASTDGGEVDLEIAPDLADKWFKVLFYCDIGLFLLLFGLDIAGSIFGVHGVFMPEVIVFGLWSAVTGAVIAMMLLMVNENIGRKVMMIAVALIAGAAVIGMYSGIDFSWMGGFLLVALLGLIGVNLYRLFRHMSRPTEKLIALAGIVVFVGFLLFDFNRLVRLEAAKENSWTTAISLSIDLYLDIINLIMDLIDFMG